MGQLLKGAQALGQQLCHRLPHVADAQREQDTLKRNRLALGQAVQKVVHRFLGHALQRQQLICGQGVQIRHIPKEAGVHQLRHGFFPEPIHIHGLPRDEMLNAASHLGGTIRGVHAIVLGFSLHALQGGSAFWTGRRKHQRRRRKQPFCMGDLTVHPHNLRDDLPTLLDKDHVADAQV